MTLKRSIGTVAPLALALAVATAPAVAQVALPNGFNAPLHPGALPSTGLGDGGIAYQGAHGLDLTTSGASHVFLFTGDAPGGEGTVTVSYRAIVNPVTQRAVCIAQQAWTMPEYAFAMEIPEWPDLTVISVAAYDNVADTVTFRWKTLGNLQPNANYSLNVICPPRVAEQ